MDELNRRNTYLTKEDVQKAYRSLSMQHHPDKGGDNNKFIQITEAKNKCLAFLS